MTFEKAVCKIFKLWELILSVSTKIASNLAELKYTHGISKVNKNWTAQAFY